MNDLHHELARYETARRLEMAAAIHARPCADGSAVRRSLRWPWRRAAAAQAATQPAATQRAVPCCA